MIAPINMDDFHAARIDGTPNVWADARSSRESARVFREERVAASHPTPTPIRHRRGNTLWGFISNPTIILAELAVIVTAAFLLGFMAGGAA